MKKAITLLFILASSILIKAECWQCQTKAAPKLVYILTNSVTVTNLNVETSLIQGRSNGMGITNLPANFFTQGKILRLSATGVTSSPAVPGNRTYSVKFNSTVMASTGAQANLASLANKGWRAEVEIICIRAGSSGVFRASGYIMFRDPTTLGSYYWDMINFPAQTITVNTTAAIAFDFTTLAATALGNSTTCQTLRLEQSN